MLHKKEHGKLKSISRILKKIGFSIFTIIREYLKDLFQPKNRKRIFQWMFFGVILSLLPLYLSISQDSMSADYSFESIKNKYAADFILSIFAVSANLLGCAIQDSKIKLDGFCISILSMLYCTSKYTHLNNPKTELRSGALDNLLLWLLVALIINTIFGIFLQKSQK